VCNDLRKVRDQDLTLRPSTLRMMDVLTLPVARTHGNVETRARAREEERRRAAEARDRAGHAPRCKAGDPICSDLPERE
jgi:hypothetical protein